MTHLPVAQRTLRDGEQRVFHFPNGYGASVVRHSGSYGSDEGLWELAVVRSGQSEDPFDFKLTYSTPITDDVRGYLTEADVQDILGEIQSLPSIGDPLPERTRESDASLGRALGSLMRMVP